MQQQSDCLPKRAHHLNVVLVSPRRHENDVCFTVSESRNDIVRPLYFDLVQIRTPQVVTHIAAQSDPVLAMVNHLEGKLPCEASDGKVIGQSNACSVPRIRWYAT